MSVVLNFGSQHPFLSNRCGIRSNFFHKFRILARNSKPNKIDLAETVPSQLLKVKLT